MISGLVKMGQITLLLMMVLSGCTSVPTSNCGLSSNVYAAVKQYHRGPVNGGFDDNSDGKVDHIEAFSSWDFFQLERVLHSGIEHKEYFWANIDTCYKFHVIAFDFYEDRNMPVLYQTCRDFSYTVYSPKKILIGSSDGKGCRNFTNHTWEIL
jgi:hypothetical protein